MKPKTVKNFNLKEKYHVMYDNDIVAKFRQRITAETFKSKNNKAYFGKLKIMYVEDEM